jgi:hypothetical protein
MLRLRLRRKMQGAWKKMKDERRTMNKHGAQGMGRRAESVEQGAEDRIVERLSESLLTGCIKE